MRRGQARVVQLQHPALGEAPEGGRQRGDCPLGATFVEGAAELREAPGLADDQPAQLQDPGLHHDRELPACQVAKVRIDVAAVLEGEHLVGDRVADFVEELR